MQKFFLYARKSTDIEDKQILSIEAQITELRAFAQQNNLDVVEEFIEKQSAKIPGRPIFNAMIKKIENGEANGVLAWHPDRLARDSVDGGKIIYLIDCGRITALKFPQFWFEPTPQGKFMLNIAFGQSKYYIDSLSENVRRGLRQKVRRGEYPGPAPIGYINDQEQKRLLWIERRQKLSKPLLNFTRKIILILKIYLTFWRKKGFCEEAEKFGTKTEQNIFSLIPFTTDIFVTPKKFMKASTSQSSQRNFLIKFKKF